MLAALLNAVRIIAPATAGPAMLIILPTVIYILATRKVDASFSFK